MHLYQLHLQCRKSPNLTNMAIKKIEHAIYDQHSGHHIHHDNIWIVHVKINMQKLKMKA